MPNAPPANATPVIVASPAASSMRTSLGAIAGIRIAEEQRPDSSHGKCPRVSLGEQRAPDVATTGGCGRCRARDQVVKGGTRLDQLGGRHPPVGRDQPGPEDVVPAEVRAGCGERLGERRGVRIGCGLRSLLTSALWTVVQGMQR